MLLRVVTRPTAAAMFLKPRGWNRLIQLRGVGETMKISSSLSLSTPRWTRNAEAPPEKLPLRFKKLPQDIYHAPNPVAYRFVYNPSNPKDSYRKPLKKELYPFWNSCAEADAKLAVEALMEEYRFHRAEKNFKGMDLMRKYLTLGYRRARWKWKPLLDTPTKERQKAEMLFTNALIEILEEDRLYGELKEKWMKGMEVVPARESKRTTSRKDPESSASMSPTRRSRRLAEQSPLSTSSSSSPPISSSPAKSSSASPTSRSSKSQQKQPLNNVDIKFPSRSVDYRQTPDLYRVHQGERGVLICEPYKSEILPHWRFRNPAVAQKSAEELTRMYENYKAQRDFVGMDMTRKFIQMGYTRAMRYANHAGGRKYDEEGKELPKVDLDAEGSEKQREKKEAADIFKVVWKGIEEGDEVYMAMRKEWVEKHK